jgi:hypothetical protein
VTIHSKKDVDPILQPVETTHPVTIQSKKNVNPLMQPAQTTHPVTIQSSKDVDPILQPAQTTHPVTLQSKNDTNPVLQPAQTTRQLVLTRNTPIQYFNKVDYPWQQRTTTIINEVFQQNLQISQKHQDQRVTAIGQPSKLIPIQGDGNCFFRAISFAITGTQLYHAELRQSLIIHFLCYQPIFNKLLKNDNVLNYLQHNKMAQNGIWATEMEIIGTAHMLSTDLVIYSQYGNHKKWLRYSGRLLDRNLTVSDRAIFINHAGGVHYELVETVQCPDMTRYNMTTYFNKQEHLQRAKDANSQTKYKSPISCKTQPLSTKETNYQTMYKRKKRQDQNYKQQEIERETACRRIKRTHKDYKDKETIRETVARKITRTDKDYKHRETVRDSAAHKRKRAHKDYKHTETVRESTSRKQNRADKDYKDKETIRETAARKITRTDKDYKHRETVRDSAAHKRKRADKDYKHTETVRESAARKITRTDKDYKHRETVRDTAAHKRKRTDKDYKDNETKRERIHRKTKRKKKQYRHHENQLKKLNRQNLSKTLDDCIDAFHKKVSHGPTYICVCCEQLWYRHSVTRLPLLDNAMAQKCLQHVTKTGQEYICHTCTLYLKKGNCPPSAVYNNMVFPEIPEELTDLHELEWRLISPRLAFMKIHAAPRGGQRKIMGNVVNVPADIETTVKFLPRMTEENATIKVNLKRHLKYKHSVMSQNMTRKMSTSCLIPSTEQQAVSRERHPVQQYLETRCYGYVPHIYACILSILFIYAP